MNKPLERLLLLLALIFLGIGFVRRSFYPVQPTQSLQGHGSKILGVLTQSQTWSLQWQCPAPALLTIQVDSDMGTFHHTIQCNNRLNSTEIPLTGTLYLAISGDGDWIITTPISS